MQSISEQEIHEEGLSIGYYGRTSSKRFVRLNDAVLEESENEEKILEFELQQLAPGLLKKYRNVSSKEKARDKKDKLEYKRLTKNRTPQKKRNAKRK